MGGCNTPSNGRNNRPTERHAMPVAVSLGAKPGGGKTSSPAALRSVVERGTTSKRVFASAKPQRPNSSSQCSADAPGKNQAVGAAPGTRPLRSCKGKFQL